MGTENPPRAFDENAALDELERLREEIRRARAHREQKVEEFEAWVRTNRNTARAERIAAIEQEAASAAPAGGARSANRGTEQAAQSSAALASASAPAVGHDADRSPQDNRRSLEVPLAKMAPMFARPAPLYAGAAAVVLLTILVTQFWGNGSETEQPPPESTTAAGSPASTSATAAAAPAQNATPSQRPLEIELTTIRPVWMRVTVDGDRRLEREVPADQRLTFAADRAIVLRVGDGGGVRLKIGGRDEGLLGRDGQIAVRTLTARQP